MAVRFYLWRQARIADRDQGGLQVFTVTHPFHPLRGQTFEILAVRNNWGGNRVSYLDTKGRLRTVPVEWTDIYAPDPVITVGAGLVPCRPVVPTAPADQGNRRPEGGRLMLGKLCALCLGKYVRMAFL